ncbi:MAG: ankyrin repeat domain-containing protein [Alphaproteobacteria bacterium]
MPDAKPDEARKPEPTLAEAAKAVREEAAAVRESMNRALKAMDKTLSVLEKPYLEAAQKGDVPAMSRQLEKGARLLATDSCGNTALFFAAQGGHLEAVKFLLKQGIPQNVKNSIKSTPLMGAAGHGHMEVAKLLVEAGSDPFYKNITGMSAYGYASSAKQTAMMEYLNPPRPEEVEFRRQDGTRGIRDVFNFEKKEHITFSLHDGVTHIEKQEPFAQADKTELRKAFNVYKQRGGKQPEAEFFPAPVEAAKPAAVKKRRWGLF